jgi:hypothetical protein
LPFAAANTKQYATQWKHLRHTVGVGTPDTPADPITATSNQDAMLQIPLLPEFAFSSTGDQVRVTLTAARPLEPGCWAYANVLLAADLDSVHRWAACAVL